METTEFILKPEGRYSVYIDEDNVSKFEKVVEYVRKDIDKMEQDKQS